MQKVTLPPFEYQEKAIEINNIRKNGFENIQVMIL